MYMGIQEEVDQTGADFFETPTIEVPASPPEAHRVTVTGVALKRIESRENWPVIEISVVSLDVPTKEDRLGVFVPKGFESGVALGSKFDPTSLPEEKGNYFTEEQTMFARSVANGDKTSVLQKLVFNADSVARGAGRDPVELGLNRKPATLDEYTENIAKMLLGVEAIGLFREKGGEDPAFKHALQIKEIVPANTAEVNPKKIKKYQKAWESN
jgi:hypothetical protein